MSNIRYFGKRLSLYYIAKYMLGYSKLTTDVHKRWCDDLERSRRSYKRIMLLKPRGTYKSSIYTISQVVELIMEDYIKHKKFTQRILIVSATDDLATQLLYEIKQHLMNDDAVKDFFGRNIIMSENKQAVFLSPRIGHKEPNIKARGSGSAIVGEHYDVIIADDIVNSDDRESEAKRERNAKWFEDIISIIEPDGYVLVAGTRWHLDDVYGRLIVKNKKLKPKFQYHIEVEKAVDDDGRPNFPSILPADRLEALRIEKGVVEFASQYMNDPLSAGIQIFDKEKMHFYTEYGAGNVLYQNDRTIAYLDPALGREGDYIVFVIGTVKDNTLLVRDAVMTNSVPIMDFINIITNYYAMYDFTLLYIETNGFQSLVADACRDANLPVQDVGNRKKKEIRIESMEPFFSSGKIKFRDDWEDVYEEFVNQICNYPVDRHDDAPDALEGLARAALFNHTNVSGYANFVRNIKVNKKTNSNNRHELNPRRRHGIIRGVRFL